MFSEDVLVYKNSTAPGEEITRKTNSFFTERYFNNQNAEKKFSPPFVPGEIYFFRYQTDSKISKDRPFINRLPLILCTDVVETEKSGTLVKGIDLIVVPPKNRIDILGKFYDNFRQQIKANDAFYENGSPKIPVRFSPTLLDSLFSGTGYKQAIFGFKYRFIRTPGVIDSSDWAKLPYLSANLIEGMLLQGIYREYQTKLNL